MTSSDHHRLFFLRRRHPHRESAMGRQTLTNKSIRYRKPYSARHSSVSWSLMIGKNPLWVARQHGHSVRTMLEVYAAWADGAVESDVERIKRAMGLPPTRGRSIGRFLNLKRLFTRPAPLDIRIDPLPRRRP